MGVSAGFPDIEIPYPVGYHRPNQTSYHGLYIELKRVSKGKVTSAQSDWINFLREKGYCAEIARGFEEAKEIVLHYFSLDVPKDLRL